MTKKNKTNYVDALETEPRYAVLTKRGRIQILVQPTAKGLRKRGTRGWRLHSTVPDSLPDAGHLLTEAIQQAVQEMESAAEATSNNGKKTKPAKVAKE